MKKLPGRLLSLLAAGVAAGLVCQIVRDKMLYGTSYQRPGRWY